MGLRFDPIGGGQFKQAVKTIIEAESQPIKQLEARKAREEGRLKLFQEFKSKFQGVDRSISEISDFKRFREFKVELGDGANVVGVTIDKDRAQPGEYELVVDQLAQRTSVMSNAFEDPDETVLGLGFVVMNLGNGQTAEVFIDETNSSLRGVAQSINSEPSSPVRASVIKDATDPDAPWRLILTGKKDGIANAIDFPEFYFLDGSQDFYIDEDRPAKNALIFVDGFPIELESNDVADFVPGINLHLKQAKPDQPIHISIKEDVQKMGGKVKGLVDQLNGILSFINKQNQVDQASDTRNTFAGDSSLQLVEYRLRNLMHEGFGVGDPEQDNFRFVHLSSLGIEFDKSGSIAFKEDKFQKYIEKDFEGVTEAITGSFGLASQLREVLNGYTRPGDGMLAMRETSFRNKIRDLDRQIDNKVKILDRRQQALTEQFSRLQSSLNAMQKQSQYLSAALPSGGGGNLVSQLLGG